MSFDSELEAFRAYAAIYPDACILLVDTYDTIKSGVPNAIKVFREMRAAGAALKNYGIRLDSGDLSYLSKLARGMLDEAGFTDALISASNELDEYIISDLKQQGTKITLWGVGTHLITSEGCPALGGVYKLAAEEDENGAMRPKIKLSEDPEKVTNPGVKKIFRLYDAQSGYLKADLIALEHERLNPEDDLTIFDQHAVWKRMTLKKGTYTVRELLVPIFANGECVYETPAMPEIKAYCAKELSLLWEEDKRLVNPHVLPVDLSQELYDLKQRMIKEIRGESDS
jgi:nicotinate phosphoribosyltransferase